MGRPASAGDDHAQPPFMGIARIAGQIMRSAMGRNDSRLVRNAEFSADIGGPFHSRPIGIAPHDDAHHGFGSWSAFHFAGEKSVRSISTDCTPFLIVSGPFSSDSIFAL